MVHLVRKDLKDLPGLSDLLDQMANLDRVAQTEYLEMLAFLENQVVKEILEAKVLQAHQVQMAQWDQLALLVTRVHLDRKVKKEIVEIEELMDHQDHEVKLDCQAL
jgi:hypothetical protein